MRVLITDIGNRSSGDEAITIGAIRRLVGMGAEVTCLCRVDLGPSLQRAGLSARLVRLVVEDRFEGIGSLDRLTRRLATRRRKQHDELRRLLAEQDVVAIAPGGKYLEGYNVARNLLAAGMALSMNLPVVLLHHSVGPIAQQTHIALLREAFAQCSLLLVRDVITLGFLHRLGLREELQVLCGDIVLGETYPPAGEVEYDLGINIRCGFNGHLQPEVLAAFVRGYRASWPASRVLIYSTTFPLPVEVRVLAASLACDVLEEIPAYPNYVRQVGRCGINVSDSFHGTLFSMLASRPVICCQPDFQSPKLGGIHPPDQPPLEVLPGLVSRAEAEVVLQRVLSAAAAPQALLDRQQRVVEHGRRLCEAGWAALETRLAELAAPR